MITLSSAVLWFCDPRHPSFLGTASCSNITAELTGFAEAITWVNLFIPRGERVRCALYFCPHHLWLDLLTPARCCSNRCAFRLSLPILQSRSQATADNNVSVSAWIPHPFRRDEQVQAYWKGGARGNYWCVGSRRLSTTWQHTRSSLRRLTERGQRHSHSNWHRGCVIVT